MQIVLMVSLIVASIAVRSVQAAESETGSALPQPQHVTLKWLGTAGWEIQPEHGVRHNNHYNLDAVGGS